MNPEKFFRVALTVVVLTLGTVHTVAQQYEPKNAGEVQVLAAVIRAEVVENKWADKDLICFSIAGQDPSTQLVTELRKQKLHVCSQAEWRKTLACRFAIFFFESVVVEGSDSAHAKLESLDFRDVNTGSVHFPDLLHNGEYALKRIQGRWSVVAWKPAETPKQP